MQTRRQLSSWDSRSGARCYSSHALTAPASLTQRTGGPLSGLISAYVVLREPARWNRGGLVLMSAAADVEWTLVLSLQAPIGALLAALVPDAELVPAVHASDLSRNPAVVEAHEKDQLVPHGNTKSRMAYECLKAFRTLQPQYKDIAVPLLAMHGTADKVTSLPAVRAVTTAAARRHTCMTFSIAQVKRLVEAASSADKTFVPWEGAYHELFNEPEAGAVMDKLISWLSDHAAAASKL